jgi:site-specific recombinase XerD
MCNASSSHHWKTLEIPDLILQFDKYLQDYKNLSSSTIKENHVYIDRFFKWFSNLKPAITLYSLNAETLKKFLNNYHLSYSKSSTRKLHFVLRSFFKYCQLYGYMQNDFYPLLPQKRVYSNSYVPGVPAQKDDTDKGKRDYALVLLLVCYGVRNIQVRELKLKDIDWKNSSIYFKGVKNGNDLEQPLIPEVGNALLNYITNIRPKINEEKIFLSMKPPNKPMKGPGGISSIISRLLKRCDIRMPHGSMGSHVLRHTFASRLLLEGEPMKNISDMLGHKFYDTTMIYTKIDILHLTKVCLEWKE